ncbi:SLC13 family permease [Sphingomonas sp. MMS24-J13]|uniref:SLC13 family permease n=1 Tax=Sphingomonas sp. MMS24-J13 TaxID=3238686 RepID=UPI0038513E66
MNAPQALAFAIIGGAILAFAWGRFRYDLVALVALLIGIATGDVPIKHAFTGFTSEVVIIIASALIVSAAIARSGLIELAVSPLIARLKKPSTQVPVLASATAILSMLTKNVGALAILMPVALRVSRNTETSASSLLMPMSFMSLLGGLVTLVGTSTNIIVSQVREETLGKPFQMFDFAPVGLLLTGLGLVFVSFGWRLLPRDRRGRSGMSDANADAAFSTEAKVPAELPPELRTIGDLNLGKDDVKIRAVIGVDGARQMALPDVLLVPGSSLVLEGGDEALDRFFGRVPLVPARAENHVEKGEASEELRSIEAVVTPDSILVGQSAERMRLQDRYGVQLLAIRRNRAQLSERLRDVKMRAGDVLVLRAGERALPEIVANLDLLPLAERSVRFGDRRRRFLPAIILAVAMLLLVLKIIPVVTAFFGAAVMMVVVGALSMREAYGSLEPEVLILIGALTPLSEAVQRTGGTDLVSHLLIGLLHGIPGLLALGSIMLAAMACSPFLHNAPTVLILGPIAVGVAKGLGLSPDPFLMAVAIGSGCDFLTPIGHQCNTLVMGPGGYRFGDYWKLGLPLSLLVIAIGTPLIAWMWPML